MNTRKKRKKKIEKEKERQKKKKESKNKKAMKHSHKERGKADSLLPGGVEEGAPSGKGDSSLGFKTLYWVILDNPNLHCLWPTESCSWR